MRPTLIRILRAGVPAAVVLAGLGFLLAEAAGLFLDANRPARQVERPDNADPADPPPAEPVPSAVRRVLPLTMAAWGFGLVAVYEVVRRLIKGPARSAVARVPAAPDVDRMLQDLLHKAEADRQAADPVPAGVSTATPDRP